MFGFWTAHETGTMSGSAWYADREWDRLRENAVGYMQVDQPACVEAGIWGSWSNTEMKRFHQTVERRLLGQREIIWERAGKMGDASFFGLGIPMLQGNGVYSREQLAATAGATFGWWHHTLDNTLDKLDWNDMGVHLRVYGSSPVGTLLRADPALRVRHRRGRVDRAAACAAAGGRVSRAGKHPGAGPPVQGSRGPARPCRAGAARAQRRRVGRFRDARRRAQPLPEAPVTPADPGPSTTIGTYGHDMYGYTPQSTMIPSLYDVGGSTQTPRGTPERWMLETALTRERNRVTDALADGATLIADTLHGLQRPG